MRSEKQKQGCRRAEPRSAKNLVAVAFRPGGRRSVVTVSDMSFSGLMVEGASFARDDEFKLVIPHSGDINARVQWASDSVAGARFDADVILDDVVPARENYAIRRLRAFNFSSGRCFGRRGTSAPFFGEDSL